MREDRDDLLDVMCHQRHRGRAADAGDTLNAAVLSTHFLIEACQSCRVAVGRDFHRSQFRSIAANDIDRRTDSNFGN